VSFWPPIDPEESEKKYGIELPHEGYAERVRGDTFATLTLEQIITVRHENPEHTFTFMLRDGALDERLVQR
jgi:hypothetical protein